MGTFTNFFIISIKDEDKMTKKEQRDFHKSIIGSDLSNTSKMPCVSFNLSAKHCITGSKLVNVKGSVCEGCYALDGFYKVYGHIEKMKPKTEKIKNELWVSSMVWLIENQLSYIYNGRKNDKSYFRWHDSGDIQSVEHLENIAQIARKLSHIMFWLPTREYKILASWRKKYKEPKNLIIRASAHMVDKEPPKNLGLTSTVHNTGKPIGFNCKAPSQDGACLDCRACWSPKVQNISYHIH